MALTVTELLNPRTRDQIADDIFAALTAEGFPVTAWQSGSVPRTLVFVFAAVLATLWALVANVAAAAFLDTATGAWLTLHAASRFQLPRIAATFAVHSITLVNASSSPRTITPGQLLMTTAAGLRYRSTNTTNATVPGSGSVAISVRCETAGIVGNTAPTVLVTPAFAGLSFTYGSLTTRARDEETDAQLRVRCRARWAARASGATRDYYAFHILSATMSDGTSAGVTRIGWIAPPGDGSFEVVVAGADGPLTTEQRDAVETYITDVARRGYLDTPSVTNATAVLVTPNGDFYVTAGNNTLANRTRAVNALQARAASLAIGQKLDVGAIYAGIYAAQGVTDVTLSAPSGDTTVTARQVVTIVTTNVANSSKWHEV